MPYVPVNYENRRYMPEPLRRFATEVFEQAGLTADHAVELAGYLVATDLRGVLSHGTSGVAGYAHSFQSAVYNPRPEISVVRDAGATIQYDGDGGIGHLCSARAVRGAMDKAKQFGVGLALGRYCGHTGSIGNWTRMATAEGMIALFTSTAVSPSDYETVQTITNVFRDYPFSMGFPSPEGLPPTATPAEATLAGAPQAQAQAAPQQQQPSEISMEARLMAAAMALEAEAPPPPPQLAQGASAAGGVVVGDANEAAIIAEIAPAT